MALSLLFVLVDSSSEGLRGRCAGAVNREKIYECEVRLLCGYCDGVDFRTPSRNLPRYVACAKESWLKISRWWFI
jgi:hypothetical protein